MFATSAGLAVGFDHGPPGSPAEIAAQLKANAHVKSIMNHTLIILAAMAAAVALYRIIIHYISYIRTLTCLNNTTQRYFKMHSPLFASIKQHVLYAPLFRKRHNREFRLFGMSFGILPSRLQSLFFAGIIAMNVTQCVRGVPWNGPQKPMLGQLRNNAGNLAIANMIPLVIMAARNNPLIVFLNVSFESFNILHRLFGRIVVVQVLVHSIAHLMIMVNNGLFNYLLYEISKLIRHRWMGRCFTSYTTREND